MLVVICLTRTSSEETCGNSYRCPSSHYSRQPRCGYRIAPRGQPLGAGQPRNVAGPEGTHLRIIRADVMRPRMECAVAANRDAAPGFVCGNVGARPDEKPAPRVGGSVFLARRAPRSA